MKTLEPSNCEANLSGPKTFTFFSDKKSTIPSTNGCSGPTITISISKFFIVSKTELKSEISILIFLAKLSVPAFPGMQISFFILFDCFNL